MAYDLEEQEKLDTLKAFWQKYGNLITWVLIIALGSYAGWNFWKQHQRTQAVEASALYDELTRQVTAKDLPKVQRIAADVQSKYGSSIYAAMSGLAGAKAAFEANDLKTAKTQLQWVADHGNEEFKAVARLRLSGVLLDEKAYDQALKALDGEFLPQFAGPVADRKGDIYVAQNKIAEARKAYESALKAMDEKNPGRQLVQVKLEAIGGTVPPVSSAKPAAA
jgi:predicted negative regulator of RcsB-dependent stress response